MLTVPGLECFDRSNDRHVGRQALFALGRYHGAERRRVAGIPSVNIVCICPVETTLPLCSTLSTSTTAVASAAAVTLVLDANTVPSGLSLNVDLMFDTRFVFDLERMFFGVTIPRLS